MLKKGNLLYCSLFSVVCTAYVELCQIHSAGPCTTKLIRCTQGVLYLDSLSQH